MKALLYKELRLALHPAAAMFLALSAMLLIPGYPLFVTFFYLCLGVFFISLTGRENHDVLYTALLPVRKGDIVRARFALVILLQFAQLVLCIPFTVLRHMLVWNNPAGLSANTAFFGGAFVLFGLFNFFFFKAYYKNVTRVGISFLYGCIAFTVGMLVLEATKYVVPFVQTTLNTPDPQHLAPKLAVLLCGFVVYAVLTFIVYRISLRSFEQLDL